MVIDTVGWLYSGEHSKIYLCAFPHLINHLNRADHMADRTLETRLRHVKSQVAGNRERSPTGLRSPSPTKYPAVILHAIFLLTLSLLRHLFFIFLERKKEAVLVRAKD